MRKSFRRRPELETLESMALLSGFSTAAHQGIAALVEHAPQASSSTALSGALTGTFSAGRVLGLPSTFNAKGTINPLGKAAATGTLQRHFAPLGGTMTVVTRYGKIYMNLSLPSVDGNTYRIKITGGTGMYLGASGGGSGVIWLVAKGDEGLGGSFTFTFTATMVP